MLPYEIWAGGICFFFLEYPLTVIQGFLSPWEPPKLGEYELEYPHLRNRGHFLFSLLFLSR